MISSFEFLFFFRLDRGIENTGNNSRKRREEIAKVWGCPLYYSTILHRVSIERILWYRILNLFFFFDSSEFPSKEFCDTEFWISFFFFWFDRIENTEAIGKGEKKLSRLLYYSLFLHRVFIERILWYQFDRKIENTGSNSRKRREEIAKTWGCPFLLYYSPSLHRVSIERILWYRVLNFFFLFRLNRGIVAIEKGEKKLSERIVRKKEI